MSKPRNIHTCPKTPPIVVNTPITLDNVDATAAEANLAMMVNRPTKAYLPIIKETTVKALEAIPTHFKTLSTVSCPSLDVSFSKAVCAAFFLIASEVYATFAFSKSGSAFSQIE